MIVITLYSLLLFILRYLIVEKKKLEIKMNLREIAWFVLVFVFYLCSFLKIFSHSYSDIPFVNTNVEIEFLIIHAIENVFSH